MVMWPWELTEGHCFQELKPLHWLQKQSWEQQEPQVAKSVSPGMLIASNEEATDKSFWITTGLLHNTTQHRPQTKQAPVSHFNSTTKLSLVTSWTQGLHANLCLTSLLPLILHKLKTCWTPSDVTRHFTEWTAFTWTYSKNWSLIGVPQGQCLVV